MTHPPLSQTKVMEDEVWCGILGTACALEGQCSKGSPARGMPGGEL